MSSMHSQRLTAVEDKEGTTGSTFGGLLEGLDTLDPPPAIVLLENVPSLKDKAKARKGLPPPLHESNFAAVQSSLEDRGYQFTSLVFNSMDCHIPQRRQRLYMAGVRAALPWSLPAQSGRFG